jgi:hypothetical protein
MPGHPRLSCWLDPKDVTADGYGDDAGSFHGIWALLCMGFLQVIF